MTSRHHDVTKVVILGIEYRYRSLSSIKVSSIDVMAGIVLTLVSGANDGLPVVHILFDWLQPDFVKTD